MIVLDNSIIFTSTVKISQDLNLTGQTLAWVTNAYALTFGGFLLLGGKLGDLYGRKRLFQIGLVIFTSCSLLVSLAQNGAMIISVRALQGVGSAILAPTTLALLMDNYTGLMRTRAIAYYGATAGIGSSFGLVIGGVIASYLSWRVSFLMNVPIGIGLFLLAAFNISEQHQLASSSIDWWGIILSVSGIILLVYSINGLAYQRTAAVLAGVLLVGFVWQERHAKVPIMPLALFANNERSSALVARFFYMGAMMTYFFLTPQAMQKVFGYSPLRAAIGFLPETLPQFIFAIIAAQLANHFHNTSLLISGELMTLVGLVSSLYFQLQSGYWLGIAIPMVLIGIGQGLSLGSLTVAGVAHTSGAIAGAASGVVNTIHQIGSSVGLSVVVVLTSATVSPIKSFYQASQLMTLFVLISMIASLVILRKPHA